MKATDYTSTRPLDEQPTGPFVPPDQRQDALLDALLGVELGAYDLHMITWAARLWDDPTMRTFVSLFLRVRAAGAPAGAAAVHIELPTFAMVVAEASRSLENAANSLRSDWPPVGSELTDAQAEARISAIRHIALAKAALDRAGGGR